MNSRFGASREILLWIIPGVFVGLLALWHLQNLKLPNYDAANFMDVVWSAYREIADGNLPSAIWTVYVKNGWRPIIFPALSLPFMILSGGSLLGTAGLTMVFFYALIGFYSYLLVRIFCTPLSSALAAALVVGNASLFLYATTYYADIAFAALALGGLNHLFRSEGLTDISQSRWAGTLLALALCLRPAESVALVLVVACYLGNSWRENKVASRDLVFCAVVSAVALSFLVLFNSLIGSQVMLVGVAFAFVVAAGFLGFRYLKLGHRPTFAFALNLVGINFVWWMPNWTQLLVWVRSNAPGGVVLKSLGIGETPFSAILSATSGTWKIPIAVGGLALLIMILSGRTRVRDVFRQPILATGLALSVYIFICYFLFPYDGGGSRRALLAMALIVLGLWSLIFQLQPLLRKIALCTSLLIVVVQTIHLSGVVFSTEEKPTNRVVPFGQLAAPQRYVDSNKVILNQLSSQTHVLLDKKNVFVPLSDWEVEIDVFCAMLIAKIEKLPFSVGTLFIPIEEDGETKVRDKFDYALIEDFPGELVDLSSWAKSSSGKLAVKWLGEARSGQNVAMTLEAHGRRFFLLNLR